MSDSPDKLSAEVARLRQNGLVMPKHTGRAALSYQDAVATSREMSSAAGRDLAGLSASLGRPITAANYDHPEVQKIMQHNSAMTNAMGQSRGLSRRSSNMQHESRANRMDRLYPKLSNLSAGGGSGMGGDITNAIPRFYDPLEYWDLSGLPWNVADEGHRHKLHKWLRLYYATHYLVPLLIDIFTRYPLVGMNLDHKDPALKEIYEDMFFDTLDYGEFLVNMGREFWTVGECFALGSFDEDLGIWEHEELINPEDVVIDNFPLLNTQQIKIVPPDYLRRIAQTKSPAREWYMLKEHYAELIPYLLKGEHIPISPVMINQVANKLNSWDDHGTPILLRGLRTLLHEEKLMASQDAIAERLYSPFILAKLGIMDMGDGLPPWLPGPDELESVRDDLDVALSSDFRLMVHHFGLELSSVFGREQMPRLGDDFDRIERRIMMIFGVNPSLLSAGSNSQPYASSALQAEFMNQILRTFQNTLKAHYKKRALVVAEAQGHQEYIRKGQTRVPVYETVVIYDDEGNKTFKEMPKYTIPTLSFSCLALGSRVSTPNGPIATEDLVEGDTVIGWDMTNDAATYSKITHSYNNGIKDTYHITTALGRRITATAEHPFLTKSGWMMAEDLIPGTELRIGTDVSAFDIPSITEREAKFFGLIAGDGAVSCCGIGGVPMICNIDKEILHWTNHFVSGYGCSLKAKDGEVSHDITQNDQRVNPNPIKALLDEANLTDHTCWTKRVPNSVWSGGPRIWAAFLSGYCDADGTVKTDKSVSWDSCNKDLLKDCQDLLAFLNVRSVIYSFDMSKWPDPQGNCHDHPSYRLVVQSKEGLNACQKWLDPLCIRKQIISTRVRAVDERRKLSPEQAAEIKMIISNRKHRLDRPNFDQIAEIYNCSKSTVWRAWRGEYDELISTWVNAKWDMISCVEFIPDIPTWSLGVEGDHTHITEGLVTHNSFDLRDEATERQFLMGLRQIGIPIPDEKLMVGIDWDVKDVIDEYNTELKEKTIAQQRAKMDTYIALTVQGLPVPLDLKAECESVLIHGAGAGGGAPQDASGGMGGPSSGPPGGGMGGPSGGGGGIVMPNVPPGLMDAPPGGGAPAMAPGGAGAPGGGMGTVPNISNERRPGLTYNTRVARIVPPKESGLAKFSQEHPDDAGVPFWDFIADRAGGYDKLASVTEDEIESYYEEWPVHSRVYREAVSFEMQANLASQLEEEPATIEEDPEELELTDYQELREEPKTWKLHGKVHESSSSIIEKPKKHKIEYPVSKEKKYSIIDPLAPDLEEEDDSNQNSAEPK